MFHYPDTSTHATSIEYNTIPGVAAGAVVPAATPARNANYNEGFAKRKALLTGGTSVSSCIPLNSFGFFASFRDKIAPPGKVVINLSFLSDTFAIYRAAAADAGKYYFTTLMLWVPKMTFNPTGSKLYQEKYFVKQAWPYFKEHVEVQGNTQQQSGVFRISSGMRKPRHVFIWVLNSDEIDSQEQNPYVYNTYNIANGQSFTECQLEIGNGVFYPTERMRPNQEISKTYRSLMQYQSSFHNYVMAPSFDQKTFQSLFGLIYFDLRYQNLEVRNDMTKIELRYTLSGAPNVNYNIYSLVLSEEDIMVDVISNNAYIRT